MLAFAMALQSGHVLDLVSSHQLQREIGRIITLLCFALSFTLIHESIHSARMHIA